MRPALERPAAGPGRTVAETACYARQDPDLEASVSRAGYLGCLVMLGVLLMAVSCLAVFGATGAITRESGPGARVAQAGESGPAKRPPPGEPTTAPRELEPKPEGGAKPESTGGDRRPEPLAGAAPAATRPGTLSQAPSGPGALSRPEAEAKPGPEGSPPKAAEKAIPQGTVPPKSVPAGGETSIAQRLDREASGGGLKLRALGAAKTSQGERSVLAIYVRMENDGAVPIRVDPTFFKLNDRGGAKYPISKAVEASLPAIDLAPRSAPGESGKLTEGNLTFEIPKAAGGLALTYEPPSGAPLRIPLPPEFG
jgi:hypothetical protein